MSDLIIVGFGPAALTTALYCARYKMKVKLIGGQPGGQVMVSGEIENYPGVSRTTGRELAQKMMTQVQENGAEVVYDTVSKITKTEMGYTVFGDISGEHFAPMILLSTGTEHRTLGASGEKEFFGKGVTYCATCDGMFYKEKKVAVVGAGNSAAEAALYLADICTSVRVFVRKDHFRADEILVEKIRQKETITVEFETEIETFLGEEKVQKVRLKTGEERDVDGVFIEIGADPKNELAQKLGVALDKEGFILVNAKQETNLDGLLAAGDNTTGSDRFAQIATAIGEGAVAAKTAYSRFQKL